MIRIIIIEGIALACLVTGIALALRPHRGDWQPDELLEPDAHVALLTPLPAVEGPEPRYAIEGPAPAGRQLSVALRATRHPCYQYAARLAAMSWQSHKTLQRNYDVMAFTTVATAFYRRGGNYVG